MKKIVLFLFLVSFAGLHAEYQAIHDNCGRFINDIQKIGDQYIIFGQGDFIGFLDNDLNYTSITDYDINSLATMSLKSLDSTFYFTKTYNNGTGAWIEKSRDFTNFDTVKTGQSYDLFIDMIPTEDAIFITGLNLLSQTPFLYKVSNGETSENMVAKSSQTPLSLYLSHSEDIILISTSMNESSLTIYDNMLVEKQKIDFPIGLVSDIVETENRYILMSESGKILSVDASDESYEIIFENDTMSEDADLFAANKDTIYACSSIEGKHGVLFRTTDGGDSWEDIYQHNNERFTCFLIDGNKAFICTYSGKVLYNDNFTSVQKWQVLEPNTLKVYPNPSTNFLTIDIQEEIKTFSIVDLLGNIITSGVSLKGKTLDISNLSAGTYTLIVNNKSTRIIIDK